MLEETKIIELSRIFKIFGDGTRIKILYSMFDRKICVQDIAKKINMTQSAVSHQLSILKDARLVRSEKVGKIVYYDLDDDHIKRILDVGLSHIEERN